MSGSYNGVAGIGGVPWEARCTESDDTAADDRAALMALEDAGCVVYALDGEHRVRRGAVLLGGGGTQALAVAAAARALSVLDRRAA